MTEPTIPTPDVEAIYPRPQFQRKTTSRRRRSLTVDAIVDAAADVLSEVGIEELSMRRVAEHLGTGPASLYAYVANKDELLELVFDELAGRVNLPEPDPTRWREQIERMLVQFRQILVAHRGSALVGLGRIPTTPNMLKATDILAALLRAGGLSDMNVAMGLDQLLLFICADALEEGVLENKGMAPQEILRYYHEVQDFYTHLSAEEYPTLAEIGSLVIDIDVDRFTYGLATLLTGLEAQNETSGEAT